MKIFYSALNDYTVQKLIISSLEQSLYQAIVVVDGTEHVVWKNAQKTLSTRSLVEMRELFEALDIPEVVLRHESPYDEMIGHTPNIRGNRLEVPLGKRVYSLDS